MRAMLCLLAVLGFGQAKTSEAQPVSLDFDSVNVPVGECVNAAAYLASFAITFVSVSGGASPAICNTAGSAVTPTSSPNVFFGLPAVTNTDESYDLVFDIPLLRLNFTRSTILSHTALPPWSASAYDASDNLLSSISRGVQFPGQPAETLTLSGPGITRVRFAAFNSAHVTFNHPPLDDFVLCPEGCRVEVSRLSQGNPNWAAELYDHSSELTIRNKGCALTSLSMALNFSGIPNNPGSLNTFMASTDSDYVGLGVNWEPATRDASGGTGRFRAFRSSLTETLEDTLCRGFPVVVGVNNNSHFVLVTGKRGEQFLINDPGYAERTTLDAYGNIFETRGYVDQAGGPTLQSVATSDASALSLSVGSVAKLLVTDAAARRTGFDAASGVTFEEIPDSAYFEDSLEDDVTGEPPTEVGHLLQIDQPVSGVYNVTLHGLKLGSFELSIRGFSQDGSIQTPIVARGIIGAGDVSTFQVGFDVGVRLQTLGVVRTATFQSTIRDIANGRRLSLISDAFAKSLTAKVELAAKLVDTRLGRLFAAAILATIKFEVQILTNKQISKSLAAILFEDADFLFKQLKP